ncbi:MAG: ankyrin repeat protein [Rhodothermales bacterium]|jgi:ankyrin repeat protein
MWMELVLVDAPPSWKHATGWPLAGVRLLLDAGADTNMQDANGRTALMCIGSVNDQAQALEIVKALVGAGAALDVVDSQGRDARQVLRSQGEDVSADYILRRD